MEKFEYEEAMGKFVAWITEKKHGNVSNENLQTEKKRIIESVDKIIDSTSVNKIDLEGNPFALLISMLVAPSFGADLYLKANAELYLGHTLSEEQYKEYSSIMADKLETENIINYLKKNTAHYCDDSIPPILNRILRLKDTIIPCLEERVKELEEMRKSI